MRILLTGITGTLATELLPQLLSANHEVIGLSRDEMKQSLITPAENLVLYLGDVRDGTRIIEASRGCDLILHTAALKRIEMSQTSPEEYISTNIEGTRNVLHAQRVNAIPRVVLASTDKACYPINVYGQTKALAENLVLRNPNNCVIRYGNVMASRGSVIPSFIEGIERNGEIHITDVAMTRFWLKPQAAAEFFLYAAFAEQGGLFIPNKIRAFPTMKVAIAISKILGKPLKSAIRIGLRPGEKLHETLRREEEGGILESSNQSLWFREEEFMDYIGPIVKEYQC